MSTPASVPKPLLKSKTVLVAVALPFVVGGLQAIAGAQTIPGLTAVQLTAIQSVIMIILRALTAGGLSLS